MSDARCNARADICTCARVRNRAVVRSRDRTLPCELCARGSRLSESLCVKEDIHNRSIDPSRRVEIKN